MPVLLYCCDRYKTVSCQYSQYHQNDSWKREGMFAGRRRHLLALANIVWDVFPHKIHHGSKDIRGLDGPKVATEQYIISYQTSVNTKEYMVLCWCWR